MLGCLVAALVVPSTALAHVTLESSEPDTQARLDGAPREIRLRFNQPVTITSNAIQVLAPDGTVLSGTARTEDAGYVVVAPVSRLGRGQGYTVRWRVIGDDGHSPAGVFTFGVGVAAPPPTEAVGASGTTWRDDLARWALFGMLALLIGPLVVRLVVLRGPVPELLERRFHLVGVVAAFLVIDVGIAAFVLRASNALQLPIGDLPYGDLQPFAEKTRFGVAFLVMTVGFGIVAALLLVGWVLDRLELRWPALVLSLALVSGLSLSGHQATEPNSSWLSELADWLHLVAASIWVGGVATLAFLVWPLAPALRRRAFLGFARLAVALVAAMVLAGAYLALVRLPDAGRPLGDAVRPFPPAQARHRRARARLGRRPPLRRAAAARGRATSPTFGRASSGRRRSRSRSSSPPRSSRTSRRRRRSRTPPATIARSAR